jgi:predicted ATPase/DNA-binding SARP family transcriptional activator
MQGSSLATAPILDIRLLGGFEARVDDQAVASAVWRQRRAAAIVKLLALEPTRTLHREQLLDTLWPDFDPDSAANNLRVALHHARLGLERAGAASDLFLVRDGDRLVLGPREQIVVDVDSFTDETRRAWQSEDPAVAGRAVALYTGDLLPEDPYEDWAAARREGLRASYLTLLTRFSELHEARGELALALAVREKLLRADPLDEAAHVGLMRLHAHMGNRHLALRQYSRLQMLLERELGAPPDPETQNLAKSIREGHIAAVRPASPPPEPSSPPRMPGIAPSARIPGSVDFLVGRERELAELDRLLTTARLVTLTGPGGIGKTRLAMEAARASGAHFPDGVAFVDLAPLLDPKQVLSAIGRAVGIDETGSRPMDELVASFVAERYMLLVLDNLEHLRPAAQDIAGLLRLCPNLTVLNTSRIRLRLRGEHEYPVMPLAVPERGVVREGELLSELSQIAAIELFSRRAMEGHPGFTLTKQNIGAVIEICQSLDGLPLAIELAAAQVRVLTPIQLLQRLEKPLDALGTTAEDVPDRQRTLRTTIAWSHDLLAEEEQVLFRRLSIFTGGWSLDGTEAVASIDADPGADTVLTLSRLIDHSLVETRPARDGAELRYTMLETIREFAVEQLHAADEMAAVEDALESFLLDLAAHAEQGLQGPEQLQWLERLEAEHDNIRAVLGRSMLRQPNEFALRLTVPLWRFWQMRGYPGEGRTWLKQALKHGANAPPALHAKARYALGHLAIELGNYAEADADFAESLSLCLRTGDRLCHAGALSGLGVVALNRQQFSKARIMLEEAHEIHCELDDRLGIAWSIYYLALVARERGDFGFAADLFRDALAMWREQGNIERIGITLVGLAMVSRFQGDALAARPLLEEAMAVSERLGHRYGAAVSHMQLGHIARLEGDEPRALRHYVDSLKLAEELGNNEMAVEDIEFVACVATALRQPAHAGRLFGAANALRIAFELPPPMDTEAIALEQHQARAEREAGDAWTDAWTAGQAMALDEAIAEARALLADESDLVTNDSGAGPK